MEGVAEMDYVFMVILRNNSRLLEHVHLLLIFYCQYLYQK